jgi:hypothetical protein
MRSAREVTSEEEMFRVEEVSPEMYVTRRNFIEPESVGTIILRPFRIVGYTRDCDGSAMAMLEAIDFNGDATGWESNSIGVYSDTTLVCSLDELKEMFKNNK